MNILLIQAIADSSFKAHQFPPLGVAYLASYLKKNSSVKHEICIATDNYDEQINKTMPQVVGISCVSEDYDLVPQIVKICKKAGVKRIIIGGYHISSMPETLLEEIDIGVLGEGEKTFCELIKLEEDGNWNIENLSKFPGIVYWDNNVLKKSETKQFFQDLDEIPLPDRSLLNISGNTTYMFTSRGCSYTCTFCSSTRFWKKTRFHSAEYVCKEIEYIVENYPKIKTIKFFDDLFIGNLKRLREISERIKEKGIHKKLNFLVSGRANLINDEVAKLCKQMNVTEVGMGLESGNQRILEFLKPKVTIDMNLNSIKLLQKKGIWVTGNFIIGCPDETIEEIMDTYNFIKHSGIDRASTYVLFPLPNTPIWNYAEKNKLIPKTFQWKNLGSNFDNNPNPIIVSKFYDLKKFTSLIKKFRRLEKLLLLRWAIKVAIKNPSKIINYYIERIKYRRFKQ